MSSRVTLPRGRRAFSLIECLAYMAVFFIIVSVAMAVYFRTASQADGLTRNSGDIVRAVQAGERWRAELRTATNVVFIPADGELRLATRAGLISYFYHEGKIWRQGIEEKRSALFLDGIKESRMTAETRFEVNAWRWELELASRRDHPMVRPRFSFLAVPLQEVAP